MLVNRDHIGLFGKMNSGKSSVMNLITQQLTSIVDSTPGTTADSKVALAEIHGIGPVKLFDTAGIDEKNELGSKKREKVFAVLKEIDLAILIIDPTTSDFFSENEILLQIRENDKQLIVVYNLFEIADSICIERVERNLELLKFYPKIEISAINSNHRAKLIDFIIANYESKSKQIELLPFVEANEYYVLNIPMDDETPQGRYLRPQAMCEEYITRKWAYPVSYRMDLGKARGSNSAEEKRRFDAFLSNFKKRPKVIITDSQAMDVMRRWTPDDIMLTTFSIVMINNVSGGKLMEFYAAMKNIETFAPGDKVLIAEACNHSRIGEDIGTVQIPRMLNEKYPGVVIEHNFGREFQDNKQLETYKLVIHCGGCMITPQKLQARLRDLRNANVPLTNYGIILSWLQGSTALEKVMEPWRNK